MSRSSIRSLLGGPNFRLSGFSRMTFYGWTSISVSQATFPRYTRWPYPLKYRVSDPLVGDDWTSTALLDGEIVRYGMCMPMGRLKALLIKLIAKREESRFCGQSAEIISWFQLSNLTPRSEQWPILLMIDIHTIADIQRFWSCVSYFRFLHTSRTKFFPFPWQTKAPCLCWIQHLPISHICFHKATGSVIAQIDMDFICPQSSTLDEL